MIFSLDFREGVPSVANLKGRPWVHPQVGGCGLCWFLLIMFVLKEVLVARFDRWGTGPTSVFPAHQVNCHTLEELQLTLSGSKPVGPFRHPAGSLSFLDMRGHIGLPRLLLWQWVVPTEPGARELGPAPIAGGFAELSSVTLGHVSNSCW